MKYIYYLAAVVIGVAAVYIALSWPSAGHALQSDGNYRSVNNQAFLGVAISGGMLVLAVVIGWIGGGHERRADVRHAVTA